MFELKQFYCDLDGVLANFDQGVKDVTGKIPSEIGMKEMWRQLSRTDDFYYNLEFMPDGEELWDYIKEYDPIILTGVPWGNWAPGQKKRWVGDNLGWDVEVITGWSKEKYLHSGEGHILIDDRLKAKKPWECADGTFIHHISTECTIEELKELGL